MQIIAKTSVRVAPRKIRLVADSIRNLSIDNALTILSVLDKRGAGPLEKTLKSAIANATNNSKIERSNLTLKAIEVLEAPSYKRYHPSTKGRIHPYKRRGSNIKIILEAKTEEKAQSIKLPEKVQKSEVKKKEGEKHGTKS